MRLERSLISLPVYHKKISEKINYPFGVLQKSNPVIFFAIEPVPIKTIFFNPNPIFMIKALINFSNLSDGNFLAKAQNIESSMEENPNFPTPSPTVEDLAAATGAYGEAYVAASTGNHADVATKNAMRQALTDLLKSLAANVTSTANGDRSKLLTSGFDVSKEKEPIVITKPENIQVTNGLNSGDLEVSVTRVKGATSYVHEYADAEAMNANNWQAVTTTMSKITYNNLLAGKTYYCRVAAVGSKGQIVYSDPISRMVI